MRSFSLCTFVRFEMSSDRVSALISLQNFRKPLDSFLTANRKKTFQRIFSYNSGRKRKL